MTSEIDAMEVWICWKKCESYACHQSNSVLNSSSLNTSISRIILLNWKSREGKSKTFEDALNHDYRWQQDSFLESLLLCKFHRWRRRGQRRSPASSMSATSSRNPSVHLCLGAVSADCFLSPLAQSAGNTCACPSEFSKPEATPWLVPQFGVCDCEWPCFCWSGIARKGPTWAKD